MPNGNGNVNNMQRGRELPFPARPILPTFNSNSNTTSSAHPNLNGNNGVRLEARVKGRRYRDIYAAPAGGWPEPQPQSQPQRRPPPHHQQQQRSSDEGEGYYAEEEQEGEGEEDVKDVLDRFEVDSDSNDSNSDTAEFIAHPNSVLAREPRRRYFEAIIKPKLGHESFAVSEYYGSRDTVYSFPGGGGDRRSRWSGGSVYSRSSVLDMDKSEEARERFLERVEAMLGGGDEEEKRGGEGGRGRGQGVVVPPVPNIPERFASPRKNWPPPGKF